MAKRDKPDPNLTFWNLAAIVVFGGAVAWGVYVWTHPNYIPPCNSSPGVKGTGANCAFVEWYRATGPH